MGGRRGLAEIRGHAEIVDSTSFCGIGTGMVQPTLIFTEVLVVLGFSPAPFGVTVLRASLFLLVNQASFRRS